MSFRGKSVIVTGATSGIGRATAEAFARESASIVLVGRNETVLKDVEGSVRAGGGEAAACAVDVTAPESAEEGVKAALHAYGPPDVLVEAAGGRGGGTLQETP